MNSDWPKLLSSLGYVQQICAQFRKIILTERMEKYLKLNNSDLHLKYGACSI